MNIIRRIVIALMLTLTAAGCARTQASVFRLAPLAVSWVRGPTAPRVPVCSWLGIVVDNAIPARPQWGLSEADVVYEVPTEGMITRFLALFCGDGPDTVGPVRSLRLQFLDIAGDYSATVAHAGSSESALAAVEEHAGPVINELWNAGPFRRDQHRHRTHNAFAPLAPLRRCGADTSPLGARPGTSTELTPAGTPMKIGTPSRHG